MTCDRCEKPIAGGYWVLPAPGGLERVCRACCAPPRYPTPRAPAEADTRRMFEEVRRMLNVPKN